MKEFLEKNKLDAILVHTPANMRNISGFTGEGLVYVSKEDAWILTDSRYTIAAAKESKGFEVLQYTGNIQQYLMEKIVKDHKSLATKTMRIGFEDTYMTVAVYRTLQALFQKMNLTGWELVPLHQKLDKLRQIKTSEEIAFIKKAEAIGDEAFNRIVKWLTECYQKKISVTEKQVAAHIEFYMRDAGAEGTSFDTIAASGIHSSMPHAVPSDKVLEEGDFLTMDFGCLVNGYCSDMTRTIIYGKADEKQKEIYDVVLRAQKAALNMIKPGLTGKEVDKVARDIITEAGYGEYFGHSLGHSVGLQIHETPCFSPKEESIIKPGMIITVEPGIYVEGFGGVRIEDVVVITEDGCENITYSPKERIEIQ
ncbi:MAG: M24 family metallopeptidase [Eubacterium sp.]